MRSLLITRASNQQAGGMERLCYELMQELKKLPNTDITIIKRSGTSRLGAIAFVLYSLPLALLRAARSDVIHLGDPVLGLHGWLIKKILGKPVAVTIHGLDVTYQHYFYQVYLKLFGQFNLCMPISQHAERLLRASVVSCQLSVVINPGVQDRYFDPSLNRTDLERLIKKITHSQLPTTHHMLLTVGRLVKRKGHVWFIENVLPHLPANTVYLIAGDGPEKENIQNSARHNRQVLLLGRVSDKYLKILYNTVDAFVQPNIPIAKDAEGFGLAMLEAALCQRPVFAANLEGIPDAIHHGPSGNGTLLPPQDSQTWINTLNSFLTSPRSLPAARDYTLHHFSWTTQAQEYRAALQNIIR